MCPIQEPFTKDPMGNSVIGLNVDLAESFHIK